MCLCKERAGCKWLKGFLLTQCNNTKGGMVTFLATESDFMEGVKVSNAFHEKVTSTFQHMGKLATEFFLCLFVGDLFHFLTWHY